MENRLPLPALLSHALVAFTIEFDNEAEHRMPHSTTEYGVASSSLPSPWLVSMVMYFNCMNFVGNEGITVGELLRQARTPTNLNGMLRWRYITIGEDLKDVRPRKHRPDDLIRATPGGRRAREVWKPLIGEIEARWKERFGEAEFLNLRKLLGKITVQLDPNLPDCMPILGPGLMARGVEEKKRPSKKQKSVADYAQSQTGMSEQQINAPKVSQPRVNELPLVSLFAKLLLAFTYEFERESKISLAISANVLRVIGDEGAPLKELPRLSSVSKEAIAMALSFLTRCGDAVVGVQESGAKTKIVKLTTKGLRARDQYFELIDVILHRWQVRFGNQLIDELQKSLTRFVGDGTAKASPLFAGLEPYPDNWRSLRDTPLGLPHYPMVLHRGGFPDGS
jgi:hypothetical protein